jgi:hypothetical protein
VERAKADVILSGALELHKLADEFYDINSPLDFFLG